MIYSVKYGTVQKVLILLFRQPKAVEYIQKCPLKLANMRKFLHNRMPSMK